MKSLVLFFLLVSTSIWAAETATIQQIKGQKAILVFDEGIPFSLGQKLYINSAEGTEIGNIKTTRNLLEKKNSASLAGQFSSLKPKDSDQETRFSITGSYSWNKGQYEYGPELTYSFVDTGNSTTTTLIGGYFDYNMKPNDGARDQVHGGIGRVGSGSQSTKTSSGKSSYDILQFDVGGQAKFFMLSQVLALRTELVYRFATVDKENINGFVFNLGLQHYF